MNNEKLLEEIKNNNKDAYDIIKNTGDIAVIIKKKDSYIIYYKNGNILKYDIETGLVEGVNTFPKVKTVDRNIVDVEIIVFNDKKQVEIRPNSKRIRLFPQNKKFDSVHEIEIMLNNYFGSNIPVIIRQEAAKKYGDLISDLYFAQKMVREYNEYEREWLEKQKPIVQFSEDGIIKSFIGNKFFLIKEGVLIVEKSNDKYIIRTPHTKYNGQFDKYHPKIVYISNIDEKFFLGKKNNVTIVAGDVHNSVIISKNGIWMEANNKEVVFTQFLSRVPMDYKIDEYAMSVKYFSMNTMVEVSLSPYDLYKNAIIARNINNNHDVINEFFTF